MSTRTDLQINTFFVANFYFFHNIFGFATVNYTVTKVNPIKKLF